jgi:NAD(P)-dependent dehydrogenase (short-subunit alcohol dehydrogenase family)
MKRLEGKVAIITGGAGGIGSASAQRFAAEGAKVVIADLLEQAAKDVAARIGSGAVGLHYDAGDPASIERAIEQVVARFGRIDILFNNAAATSY